MADRIHPQDSPAVDPEANNKPPENIPKPSSPLSARPAPTPGTYVVQIPKDQIYRYPPPENARRYERLKGRKATRSCCCCCLWWILTLFITLIILLAVAGTVFYFVVKPEAPKYSVQKISITGFNLTGTDIDFSPEFNVTVRAENPNDKISIYYKKGSSVTVTHAKTRLCTGVIPPFKQGTNDLTTFQTALASSGLVLTLVDVKTLREQQSIRKIPLSLDLKVPVQIKVGSVKTWTITVKVNCDVVVDKLDVDASIVSRKCNVDVNVMPWD